MRSVEDVEVLPLVDLSLEIDVASVREELVKLWLTGSMVTLDLAAQLQCRTLDVRMMDSLFLDLQGELGMELTAVVCADFADAERELFDDPIDKVDRVGWSSLVEDLERSGTSRVINSIIFEAADFLASLADDRRELDVHLNVMAGHLLDLAFGVDFTHAGSARSPPESVSAQNACQTSGDQS